MSRWFNFIFLLSILCYINTGIFLFILRLFSVSQNVRHSGLLVYWVVSLTFKLLVFKLFKTLTSSYESITAWIRILFSKRPKLTKSSTNTYVANSLICWLDSRIITNWNSLRIFVSSILIYLHGSLSLKLTYFWIAYRADFLLLLLNKLN